MSNIKNLNNFVNENIEEILTMTTDQLSNHISRAFDNNNNKLLIVSDTEQVYVKLELVAKKLNKKIITIDVPTTDINDLRMNLPDDDNGGILFFDEIDNSFSALKGAIYSLIINNSFNTYQLPSNWIIVCSANESNFNEIDSPILNKMEIIKI